MNARVHDWFITNPFSGRPSRVGSTQLKCFVNMQCPTSKLGSLYWHFSLTPTWEPLTKSQNTL